MKFRGEVGWVILAMYIVVWDWVNHESLSIAFGRALHDPTWRVLLIVIWSGITVHLFWELR